MDQTRGAPSAREEKQLRALKRRRKREAEGRFLAEGVRVVEDLLASAIQVEWVLASSFLEDNPRGAALLLETERRGVPVRMVEDRAFADLASTEHPQGVLAVAQVPEAEWAAVERARAGAVVLLLDAVQDPGNLGTLARTAEALGAAALLVLEGTVDPWNAKAVRAAAGSLFRLPILSCSVTDAHERLKRAGYRLLAAEAGGDPPLRTPERVALVMGNEGAGISPEIRAVVDGTVGIPLRGRAESLNVAAAAAILLYEFTR